MSVLAHICRNAAFSGLAIAGFVVLSSSGAIASEKVLHSFEGGNDGSVPQAGVVADDFGNLYGTTAVGGGGADCDNGGFGCGAVFEIAAGGGETVLHAFAGGCDGALPFGGLVRDRKGNFYGTTGAGGACNSDIGNGTVFKLSPDGTETVLYAFLGASDGSSPSGNLARDKKGNLFGATEAGGDMAGCGGAGCGVVFEVTPEGRESVLYAFQGGSDGAFPEGGVIADDAGNLYGTTRQGGIFACINGSSGCGVVFKVTPDGTETVLYAFQNGVDGNVPAPGLIADGSGNFYGATSGGGTGNQGTVFQVSSGGTETVLHSFQGGSDGGDPEAGVILDKSGNLYGTTYYGGSAHCHREGCGTVFKLAPDGTETVLYALYGKHGVQPTASLLLGKHGLLYGTASAGGTDNNGVVFSVKE
jgi:uncharacterized repeat protein (TIGR03803 family)